MPPIFPGGEIALGSSVATFLNNASIPNPTIEREIDSNPTQSQFFNTYDPPWINTEGMEQAVFDSSPYSVGKKSQFFVLRRLDYVANDPIADSTTTTPEEPEATSVETGLPSSTLKAYVANEQALASFTSTGVLSFDKGLTFPDELSAQDLLISKKQAEKYKPPVVERVDIATTSASVGSDGIPNQWKFAIAPASLSWNKTGNINRDTPFGVNKQLVFYSSTSMRTLSLGKCVLDGFSLGLSVEDKIKSLEKCMEIVRNPQGFLSPYVWELFGIGKSYGYYLITSVSVNEVMRDDRGSATRATVSIELAEVPEYQIYNGRDLARIGDLVKPNFQKDTCGSSTESGGVSGLQTSDEKQFFSQLTNSSGQPAFKGSLALSKEFEGFENKAYKLPGESKYTVGYGLYGYYYDAAGNRVKVTKDTNLTNEEVEATKLRRFAKDFLPQLQKIPHWDEMSGNQQSALASFAWNLGAGFYGSTGFETISRTLREKRWNDVPSAMLLYTASSSESNRKGLIRRRTEEGKLWSS